MLTIYVSDPQQQAMNAPPQASEWHIVCDFDGTISLVDVVDSVLERFARPGWLELEEQWVQGQIGSRECLQGQTALLDVEATDLYAWLDQIPIDPDFAEFVSAARQQGHQITVASDGFDLAIGRALKTLGLHDLPVQANRLLNIEETRNWRLESPFTADGCPSGTCKCVTMAPASLTSARPILLIGDGRSDFCAANKADLVFAKGQLVTHCVGHFIPHLEIGGFGDATRLLPILNAGSPIDG